MSKAEIRKKTIYRLKLPQDWSLLLRLITIYRDLDSEEYPLVLVDASDLNLNDVSEDYQRFLKCLQLKNSKVYIFCKKVLPQEIFFCFDLFKYKYVTSTFSELEWGSLGFFNRQIRFSEFVDDLKEKSSNYCYDDFKEIIEIKATLLSDLDILVENIKTAVSARKYLIKINGELTLTKRLSLIKELALHNHEAIILPDNYLINLWMKLNPQCTPQRETDFDLPVTKIETSVWKREADNDNLPEAIFLDSESNKYQEDDWIAALLLLEKISNSGIKTRFPIKVKSLENTHKMEIIPFVFNQLPNNTKFVIPTEPLMSVCSSLPMSVCYRDILPLAIEIDYIILKKRRWGGKYAFNICVGNKKWHCIKPYNNINESLYIQSSKQYSHLISPKKTSLKFLSNPYNKLQLVMCASKDNWEIKKRLKSIQILLSRDKYRTFAVLCAECVDLNNPLFSRAKAVLYQTISPTLYQWLVLHGVVPIQYKKLHLNSLYKNQLVIDFTKLTPNKKIKAAIRSRGESDRPFFIKYGVNSMSDHACLLEEQALWAAMDLNQ